PGPGFYTVCLTVRNAYGSDTKCKVVEVKTSTVENSSTAVEYLRVLPNPTTGMVRFPWSDAITRHIRVHDSIGRVVLSLTMDGQEMDMSQLPGGVYTLHIEEKDRRYTGKVVVLPH
ncbi:MAG TPA: T9SS type A sorting domain-containing protein, partial [Saprospiraceae bacterium]|nr:T9SS type A sorting domain-containing protein [Saprospiraceae bacterium]